MNRRRKGTKKRRLTLQTWSRRQAEAAIPYIRSVLRSLREHHLEMQAREAEGARIAGRPGRPNRGALIAMQQAEDAAGQAAGAAAAAAEELLDLDIFCLDPVRGEALIPFVSDDQLAWYLFDLFDEKDPIRYWRLESDTPDTRRPITPLQEGAVGTVEVA